MDLSEYVVARVPPQVYYVPNFITEIEEDALMSHVNAAPKPKWTQLSNRRLQNWGGIPHPKGMIAERIPTWLQEYMSRIGQLGIFKSDKMPNHVLVNEYLSGQGIMPHTDGPLFHPIVTTITCGSHTVLEFVRKDNSEENYPTGDQDSPDKCLHKQSFSLLLERRSLVVIQDDVYKNYLHSIEEVTSDIISNKISNLQLCLKHYNDSEVLSRGTRISLTIRHVPATTKVLLRLSK